mgnify:CR=1 FL=1
MLIKTNKALKQKAQKLAKEMGLPLGTLVNNYLRNFIVDRQAVFNAPIPNKKTAAAIEASRKEFKAGKTAGPFNTVEEMMNRMTRGRCHKEFVSPSGNRKWIWFSRVPLDPIFLIKVLKTRFRFFLHDIKAKWRRRKYKRYG